MYNTLVSLSGYSHILVLAAKVITLATVSSYKFGDFRTVKTAGYENLVTFVTAT